MKTVTILSLLLKLLIFFRLNFYPKQVSGYFNQPWIGCSSRGPLIFVLFYFYLVERHFPPQIEGSCPDEHT